jgi:phosphatidylglycerophosphate synthase
LNDQGFSGIYIQIRSTYSGSAKQRQDFHFLCYPVYRYLSFPLAALLISFGISANLTTLLGLIALVLSIMVLVSGSSIALPIGIALYWLAYVLDFADGTIARFHDRPNYFGKLIDGFVDYLALVIFIPVAIANVDAGKAYFPGQTEIWLAVIAAISAHALLYCRMRIDYFFLEMTLAEGGSEAKPPEAAGVRQRLLALMALLTGNVIVAAPVVLVICWWLDQLSIFIVGYTVFYAGVGLLEVIVRLARVYRLSNVIREM